MVTITITITDDGVPDSLGFRMEGEGKECNSAEIKMAQRVIRLVQKEIKDGVLQIIVPQIESITKTKDKPQPN